MSRIAFPENPTPEEVEALLNELQRCMRVGVASPIHVINRVMEDGAAALKDRVIRDPDHPDFRYRVHEIPSPSVRLHREGGGLSQHSELSWLAEHFEEIPEDQLVRPYRSSCVSIDADPEIESFPCYLNGDLWNGFDKPYFTYEVALQVARMFNGGDPVDAVHPDATEYIDYSTEQDAFIEHSAEGSYAIPAEAIVVDGQEIKVYGLGAGSWCWGEVEPEPAPAPKKSPSIGM